MPFSKVIIKQPKLTFTKLSKKWWGLADKEQFAIYLHNRIPKRMLHEIYIHETLHCILPDLTEKQITDLAGLLADGVWNCGYRKVK